MSDSAEAQHAKLVVICVYGATVFRGSTQREGNRAFVDFMRSRAAHEVLHETASIPSSVLGRA
jgi:ABC-type molybdate transport system substrate-binding protein